MGTRSRCGAGRNPLREAPRPGRAGSSPPRHPPIEHQWEAPMPFLRASALVVILVAALPAPCLAAGTLPRGYVDEVTQRENEVTVTGWAMSPEDPARDCEVHFYLDGFPGK